MNKVNDLLNDIKKRCDMVAELFVPKPIDPEAKSIFDQQVTELKLLLERKDTELAAAADQNIALMKEVATIKTQLQEAHAKEKKEKVK